jgi:hypothetical protein
VTHIKQLQDVIWELHGVASRHVGTVPVKETFKGDTVWEGNVEVFDLHKHPKTHRAYAWTHDTDDPKHPHRHVTVLHIPPVVSPETAVKAAIVQEHRGIN